MRFHALPAALLAFLFLAHLTPAIPAQQSISGTTSENGTPSDSAAIRQVFSDFCENFTRHDAHATAMTFAADADFTNMNGIHRRGRQEIEDGFAALFAGRLKDSVRTDVVRNIRFYSPDLAAVDADTLILGTKTADGSAGPPRKGLMIVSMTKRDGRWLIGTFHEAEFPVDRGATTSSPANK